MVNKIIKIVTISITCLALSTISTSAFSAKQKLEKCTGIVKAGKADGQSTIKGKKVDWILVPAGACLKLVGGKVIFDK